MSDPNASLVEVVNVPDGADEALGTTTDPEAAGDGTLIAIAKRQRSELVSILTALLGTLTVSITGAPTVTVAEPLSIDDDGGSLTVDDGGASLSVDDNGGSLTVDGTLTVQDGGGSLTVDDGGGSVTVDGTVTVQDGGNVLSVDDAGGSLTVDGTVTVQDGGGAISVDDNGGSLTVDGAVTVSGAVDTELTTADLDTGAGADTRAVVGMVLAESGGGQLVGSDHPLPVSDNGGSLSVDDGGGSLTVDGSVTVDDGGGSVSVDDNGGSLTVDGTVTVQDGGGSLTVDGTVAISGAVDTELTTADLDTGAGSDARAVVGVVLAASGGGVLLGTANPMPVSDNGGSLTVDGTVTVQDGGGSVSVDDNGSTISVDDGGGSLTVDGAVTVSGTVDTELTTSDLDTGAGTDSRAVVGMVLAESGGGLLVGSAHPMPVSDNGGTLSVDDGGGSLTVDGTVAISGAVPVTDNGGNLSIDDGGNSITVDDGGGSLTVDGSVTVSGTVDTELTTADLDTGAGTDTRAVVGLAIAESGGGLLVGSAHPLPISDNGGSVTVDDGAGSLTVDGTVAVTQSTTPWVVGDGGGSLTVDGTVTVQDGGGSISVDDNGGALSVDDNGGSLTVDGTVATTVADGVDVALGATTDAAASSDAGSFSLISLFKRLLGKFTTQFPAALTVAGSLKTAIQEAIAAGDNLIGRVKVTDGATVASVRDLASSNPQDVAIVDADGNQITSFGGGTQYSEGDTDTSITGTALCGRTRTTCLQPRPLTRRYPSR
jgi:hypothetical protein